jgi:prepilin-type N-terminal cleavage/methylation domain-containing protein
MHRECVRRGNRRGFTLVELLVVIIIISVLATLVLALGPRFADQQRTSSAAGQLQSWLLNAKQRAVRDRAPRGIRFIGNPSAPYIYQFQYVEQPDDISGIVTGPRFLGKDSMGNPVYDSNQVMIQGATYSYGYNVSGTPPPLFITSPTTMSSADYDIRTGDILYLTNQEVRRRIVGPGVTPAAGTYPPAGPAPGDLFSPAPTWLNLDQPVSAPNDPFRIIRLPKPVPGEPTLELPKGVAIDVSTFPPGPTPPKPTFPPAQIWQSRIYPFLNTGTDPLDLVFSPSGQVIGPLASSGRICLWVRDVSLGDPNNIGANFGSAVPPGDNTLIVIYTHTGQITAHQVDPTIATSNTATTTAGKLQNPFSFTQSGTASGL